MSPFRLPEQLRAAAGAVVGLLLCSLLVATGSPVSGLTVALVAPLGASAVLLFAVPNSPLAQPWSALVGNVISALVALAALTFVPAPWTAGLAVGGAILAMMMLRALHPPGGAVALLSVLDPEPVLEAGVWFAFVPVGITTATLVVAAIGYNHLTGRAYPFRQADTPKGREAALRLGLTNDDLGALLSRFNQSTNLGVADLGRLLAAAEEEAAQHRFNGTTCADVMTRDLITARPDAPLTELARLFRDNAIKSLPVIDDHGKLLGLVLQADLIAPLIVAGPVTALRQKRSTLMASDIMRPATAAVPHDLPVGLLLNRLAAQGVEVVPVTRAGQLAGILTRSDIIGLLLRGSDERRAGLRGVSA